MNKAQPTTAGLLAQIAVVDQTVTEYSANTKSNAVVGWLA